MLDQQSTLFDVQDKGAVFNRAVARGDVNLVEYILKTEGSKKARELVNYSDTDDNTPLLKAAGWDNEGMVRLLIANGAHPTMESIEKALSTAQYFSDTKREVYSCCRIISILKLFSDQDSQMHKKARELVNYDNLSGFDIQLIIANGAPPKIASKARALIAKSTPLEDTISQKAYEMALLYKK